MSIQSEAKLVRQVVDSDDTGSNTGFCMEASETAMHATKDSSKVSATAHVAVPVG